jgi:hypothetical protein
VPRKNEGRTSAAEAAFQLAIFGMAEAMPLSKTIFVLSYSPGELSLVRGALRLVGAMVDNGSGGGCARFVWVAFSGSTVMLCPLGLSSLVINSQEGSEPWIFGQSMKGERLAGFTHLQS